MSVEPRHWERAFLMAQAGEEAAALSLALDLIEHHASPEAFEIAASLSARRGETEIAANLYRRGLSRYPADHVLVINGARLLRDHADRADEALGILDAYLGRHPNDRSVSHTRIETLRTSGRLEAAESAARAHVARFPAHGGGHLALALALFDQKKMVATLAACEQAARFREIAARAWELAANAHVALGNARETLSCYREALRLAPDPELHSRLLMSTMYCDDVPVTAIHAEARRWADMHMAGVQSRSRWPHLAFEPDRRLRVGFLAGDFRQCSTPHLAFPLWQNLPERWDVTLYDNAPSADLWGDRFRRASSQWRDISALSDEEICALVMADGIDVLFDLEGHTLGGRPGVFHRKPAPIQIAWLDYVGTTGLRTYDAIIGDAHHLPHAEQYLYAEPIRHVRDNLYRYHPPEEAPEVGPLPALQTGSVTFGCFNSAYKLSPSVLDLWAAILARLPASTLLLNSREYGCPDTRERFREAFAMRGIDSNRIILRAGAPTPHDLMASYAEVDIALDPFPYSGGLTTLEALFMGVPVITMPGDRFGSRHSTAHLRTVGLGDWIADSPDAYIALAVEKSGRLEDLAMLRTMLRDRLIRSSLCDGARIAQDMNGIVSGTWARRCCEQAGAGGGRG
jgi:predicted O-linked N-acetylglucosamine transferase (SPINDLY family)